MTSTRTRSSVALLATVASWALASPAMAEPRLVRVSWTETDTATTATVTWHSDSTADPSIIEFGTTPEFDGVAQGASALAPGDLDAVHEVALTGLLPATEYHYHVGGPGGWSPTYTFKTGIPDACEPFRFIALGDNRDDLGWGPSIHWNSVISEAFDQNPAFIVNTGDLVKDGDEDQQWLHYLEATDPRMASIPMMPSLGNHDDDKVDGDAAMYNQLFAMPRNDVSGTEDYYFFTYGDAIFVALSSQTFEGGTEIFGEQAEWLDKVLTENPKTWKFVYFHHPIYTGVIGAPFFELGHPPNEKNQNATLVPVFDKHHVDVVFNGHNHFYQRFEPMCCGGGADMGQPTGDPATGTTYIVTGGGGATTYDIPFIPELICLSTANSVACSGKHHYVLAEIAGSSLHLQVWTTESQLLSNTESNVDIVDEWTIVKDGPAPDCSGPDPEPDPPPVEAEPDPVPVEEEPVAEPPPSAAEQEPVAEPIEDTATGPADPPVGDAGPEPAGDDTTTTAPADDAGAGTVDSTVESTVESDGQGGEGGTGATTDPDATTPAGIDGGGTTAGTVSVDTEVGVEQRDAGGCAGSSPGMPWPITALAVLLLAVLLLWWRRADADPTVS